MNITIAKSWNELTDWQLNEIAHLYLTTTPEQFSKDYEKMVLLVYRKDSSIKEANQLRKLANEVPISELAKHTDFLISSTSLSRFPEIKGLIKPADGLGDITIRHFSTIDLFFMAWYDHKTELNLKRLVASLYRIKEKYDDLDLPKVDEITRKLSLKQMHAIALAYRFIRESIQASFPVVFPKKPNDEEEKLKPVFKKQQQYIPFDRTIVSMAMDELQPLGKKQDVDQTRIYEFFSVLSETMLYHEKKQKNAGK